MIETAKKKLQRMFPSKTDSPSSPLSSSEYWTEVNVTNHHQFSSVEDSLDFFHWRNSQYSGYIDMMPVSGQDGKVVLDYGCGPGHDTVGLGVYSAPKRLIAMDVSPTSLAETKSRVELHQLDVDIMQIDENDSRLPLEDSSVDHIHSSGVIHHTPNPQAILAEFRRILRDDGEIRIMVYNYDSIYLHLYTAYIVQLWENRYRDLSVRDAFRHLTDGDDCPISNVYRPDEFLGLANEAGLQGELLGCAVSNCEMLWMSKRFEAIGDRDLAREHRDFLTDLTFDNRLRPMYGGRHAGVDGCYRFWKS